MQAGGFVASKPTCNVFSQVEKKTVFKTVNKKKTNETSKIY